MPVQWTCLVVVLWACVTSSTVLDHPGNVVNRHGDEVPDVREETTAPPTDCPTTNDDDFNIYSNEAICRELCKKGDGGNACLCDWPPLKKQIIFSLKNLNRGRALSFVKFPTPENEPACRLLCPNGDEHHFCLCE